MSSSPPQPFIVGIGGTAAKGSSTEQALSLALSAADAAGARTQLFGSEELLALPHYVPGSPNGNGRTLIDAVRRASGLIIASPGYHGTISGLVKNAIDYLEETSKDERVYLDGVPVGLIATAYGWQATGGTLGALRSIVHALRGWPTPMGAAINTSGGIFSEGVCKNEAAANQLRLVGLQVVEFATASAHYALQSMSLKSD